jgi:hypothetical protein
MPGLRFWWLGRGVCGGIGGIVVVRHGESWARGKMWTAIDDGGPGVKKVCMLDMDGLDGAEWRSCGSGTKMQ